MKKEIQVAIGVLVRRRGDQTEVLITQRPHDRVLGGLWEFPGGKVEPGETPQQCVVREFEEELAVVVRVLEPFEAIRHTYDHGRVCLQPFLCARVSGEPKHIEVIDHKWVTHDVLGSVTFPEANRQLVTAVRSRLVDFNDYDDIIAG